NGVSKETGWRTQWPKEGLKSLWKAKVGIGFSSVSVGAGRVYIMGNHANQDSVFCFDAASGTPIWKHTYDCPLDPRYYDGGTSCTPTVDAGVVFTLSRKGHLFALDAAKGSVVWKRDLVKDLGVKIPEWGFASSPLVEGNLLILNVGDFGTAVDKASGKVVWTNGKGSAGYSSAVPFTYGGKRYVSMATLQHVAGIEVVTGTVAWKHPWKTEYDINAADPVIHGDQIFISSGYEHAGALLQLTKSDPSVVWQNKLLKTQFSTAVVIDGSLYGVDGNNGRDCTLKCLDWNTGAMKWERKGSGMGSLMAADGKLIVQWEKGELALVAADPSQYGEL
ncbi:MAG: PQQ-binding-like beta-propeller repeat protein, partial [Verrucomicrobiales bacterium]